MIHQRLNPGHEESCGVQRTTKRNLHMILQMKGRTTCLTCSLAISPQILVRPRFETGPCLITSSRVLSLRCVSTYNTYSELQLTQWINSFRSYSCSEIWYSTCAVFHLFPYYTTPRSRTSLYRENFRGDPPTPVL